MTWPPEQPPPYPSGYPPPGYGYSQYPAQPPVYPTQRTTNGFAVAALVLGVVGFIWICAVMAVIFGIIALTQTKGGRQQGRGMAIAGLVLAGLWTVVLAVAIALVVVTAGSSSSVRATDVEVGDCIKDVPTNVSDVFRVPKVSCDKPHHSEVFAIFRVSGNEFPGEQSIESEYGQKCGPALEDYAPAAADDALIRIDILYPIRSGWERGDRDVVCIATSTLEKTSSIKK